jgi:methyltransferase (TIGR00027 family)
MVQTAMLRAAHQLLDRPLVFADPIAVGLVPDASEQAILAAAADFRSPPMMLRRASMVLRSRFVEDRLTAAAQRGVRQYVIAAAGLDTFPWRQPIFARDMRIFFADLPASLAWVKERLRERGLAQPSNLTFVPVDLEELRLGPQLITFGLDPRAPMFCSALGIMQYLTPQAVDALLTFAASAPTGSEIAFSFSPPDDELDGLDLSELRRSVARGQRFGEPWLSHMRPRELIFRLKGLGFTDVVHLTPELAQERYFGCRHDGLKASRSGQVIAAVV